MLTYSLALSRLVPILFWLSFCMVAARFLKDRLDRANKPFAGRILFPAILIFGVVVAIPYFQRMYLIVAAERAYLRQQWPVAASRYDLYRRLGGSMKPRFVRHLVISSMNLRLWNEAEEALTSSDAPELQSADLRVFLGMCRYYKGDLTSAAQILLNTPDSGAAVHLRHYFLGRIAEAKGDVRTALAGYDRALRRDPNFYPAAYQMIRLLAPLDPRAAAGIIDVVTPVLERQPGEIAKLKRAVQMKETLPPREFYVIQM